MRGRLLFCLLAALFLLSGCKAPSDSAPEEEPLRPEFLESPEGDPEIPPETPEEAEAPEPASPLQELPEEPEPWAFVRAADYVPGVVEELRYAGTDNFTGQVIYHFTDAYLRYGTAQKLAAVQAALAEEGLGLKIWDAFRPAEAQFKLWEICPDGRYVANPNRGFPSHTRGNTLDLTLVDGTGRELEMPSGFDEFSPLADRDYGDVSPQAAENARKLEAAMTAGGFLPYDQEWWHYSDTEYYDAEEDFRPPAEEQKGEKHG